MASLILLVISALALLGAFILGRRIKTMPRRSLRIASGVSAGTLAVAAVLLLLTSGYAFWYTHRPLPDEVQKQQLFQGVTYTREVRREPSPLIIHVVEIDLQAPGIEFLSTPGTPTGGYEYPARTTSQFLSEFSLQLAINGDFFDPWRDFGPLDYYPHEGDGVNVRGMAASQGVVITEGYSPVYLTLYISQDNRVSFGEPEGNIYNAISGHSIIVQGGVYIPAIAGNSYLEQPHPRTAIALDENGQTLIFIVVDGRQPNYSGGATIPELAEIIVEYGGYTALNLDGGGSSALVIAGDDGALEILSSPIHTRIPRRERPIANHLGVYALPIR